MYKIIKHSHYKKTLLKIGFPKRYQRLVDRKLRLLAEDPRYRSLNCHSICEVKLNNKKVKVWAFYITKKYRICFIYWKNGEIILIQASNHYAKKLKDVYYI